MLQPSGGTSLVQGGGTLTAGHESGGGATVIVEDYPVGYWIDGSGYTDLNGIYVRRKHSGTADIQSKAPEPSADGSLAYEHVESRAVLMWVPQGWLLRLASGTDCFLQQSVTRLMVTQHNWMAIDSLDSDPLAEPPDEVVALLVSRKVLQSAVCYRTRTDG